MANQLRLPPLHLPGGPRRANRWTIKVEIGSSICQTSSAFVESTSSTVGVAKTDIYH